MPFRRLVSAPFKSPSVIVAGACLLVAAIGGLTGAALYEMRQDALGRARELAGNIALILERDIARSIEIYDLSLQAVIDGVDSPEVMALPPAMRQLVLFDRSSDAKNLGSMLVIDTKGRVVVDSRSVKPRAVQLAWLVSGHRHNPHPARDIAGGRRAVRHGGQLAGGAINAVCGDSVVHAADHIGESAGVVHERSAMAPPFSDTRFPEE